MITASYPITGGDFASAGGASRGLKDRLRLIGVEAGIMRRVMIAAYEAEMNVVIHARRGNLWARLDGGRVDLEIADEGPGIPDVQKALTPGFSTASSDARALGFGAGMGLPNIRRASDEFEISTEAGRGTRVRATIFLKAQAGGEGPCNSVSLNSAVCVACLSCLKACPTGALRLPGRTSAAAGRAGRGGPRILEHLCVDCAVCIAVCPHRVFGVQCAAEGGDAAAAPDGQATLVLPRAFLTHFGPAVSPRAVLDALLGLGYGQVRFSEEWELALRRELHHLLAQDGAAAQAEGRALPLIAPVCPAVVNLVETHFPALIPQLAAYLSPVEAAQQALAFGPASLEAAAFVPACPSQASCLRPFARSGRLRLIAVQELADRLLPALSGSEAGGGQERRDPGSPQEHAEAGSSRVAETRPDAFQSDPRTLRVSGMASVLRTLEQAEKGLLGDFRLLEPFACPEGCFGSPLFAAEPAVARSRWQMAALDPSGGAAAALPRRRGYLPRSGARLDTDMTRAVAKLARVEELTRALPGRDCAACGAPSCSHLAEDVVMGRAALEDCPFRDEEAKA